MPSSIIIPSATVHPRQNEVAATVKASATVVSLGITSCSQFNQLALTQSISVHLVTTDCPCLTDTVQIINSVI